MVNNQHSSVPRLTVATYNTYRERKGRDHALDALLSEQGTLVCLQEVSWARAGEIKRRFGRRAYLSPVMQCWQLLVIVLPAKARLVEYRTVYPNSYVGLLPRSWSLQRVI